MILSVVVALTLTPARLGSEPHHRTKGFFGAFNRFYSKTERGYQNKVLRALRRSGGMLAIYALLCGAMGWRC
jgi:multidrug efflux pump